MNGKFAQRSRVDHNFIVTQDLLLHLMGKYVHLRNTDISDLCFFPRPPFSVFLFLCKSVLSLLYLLFFSNPQFLPVPSGFPPTPFFILPTTKVSNETGNVDTGVMTFYRALVTGFLEILEDSTVDCTQYMSRKHSSQPGGLETALWELDFIFGFGGVL